MYTIKKDWKAFNISIEDLNAKFELDYPSDGSHPSGLKYITSQAVGELHLELYFSENPDSVSPEQRTAIDSYYDGILETDSEATNYETQSDIDTACINAKVDAASKDWTVDALSISQKKLILGIKLTQAEKQQLIIDFP